MSDFSVTDHNRVRRLPARGRYDRASVYAIVDAGLVCHVGFVADGRPYVIPTLHARDGDVIYLHGASTSRMLRAIEQGAEVCVTVTHIDGLVLAKSAFNHSVNYRSALLFGHGRAVTDPDEKMRALMLITEHLVPGRWDDARLPNAIEMKATGVVAIEIESASAKLREGGPHDDAEDEGLPIWAGVLPLVLSPGELQATDYGPALEAPDYLRALTNDKR